MDLGIGIINIRKCVVIVVKFEVDERCWTEGIINELRVYQCIRESSIKWKKS